MGYARGLLETTYPTRADFNEIYAEGNPPKTVQRPTFFYFSLSELKWPKEYPNLMDERYIFLRVENSVTKQFQKKSLRELFLA